MRIATGIIRKGVSKPYPNPVIAGNVSTLTDKQRSDVDSLLNYYSKQIYFTENKGHWPGNVLYKADFHPGQAIATKDGMLVGTFDPADVAAKDEWSISRGRIYQKRR